MSQARCARNERFWLEIQDGFLEFAGVSVQVFDGHGKALQPAPKLPNLCAYFQRNPETKAACQKDCFRKAAACRDARKILPARCYAGLSYRIVPIRQHNQPQGIILVGRILTEVFGGEQCLGFIERYKLSQSSFLESLASMRTLGGPDLDRLAASVRRFTLSRLSADVRSERLASRLDRGRMLLTFAEKATEFQDRSPGQARGILEDLGKILALPGFALLICREGSPRFEVHTSIGLGEDVLHFLADQDWQQIVSSHGPGRRAYLHDRLELNRAGLDFAAAPLAALRLSNGAHCLGYLLATGAALSSQDLDLLETAAAFIAVRVAHEQVRERAEQKNEEARLLALMAEKCLTAKSVEELLPMALEAAMFSLQARRGSILLAEEKGRITARALRGEHAPISETIENLNPGSVSHKVFFERQPLLVRNTAQEPGFEKERQFPYLSHSFVSVPLRVNSHALGVLHLTEREGEGVFTDRDLSLLERLSIQASGAICKAQLAEEVQSLRVESTTDHLTGVHNRRYLEQQLAVELNRANRFSQSLAVVMFDIDDFKTINDKQGHDYGDQMLKTIAGSVRKQLRAVDILARYGGDEFVLILPGTGASGAMNTVEKIRARIAGAATPANGSDSLPKAITMSAGVAVYPESAGDAEELLHRADQALLQVKQSGRDAARLWSQ